MLSQCQQTSKQTTAPYQLPSSIRHFAFHAWVLLPLAIRCHLASHPDLGAEDTAQDDGEGGVHEEGGVGRRGGVAHGRRRRFGRHHRQDERHHCKVSRSSETARAVPGEPRHKREVAVRVAAPCLSARLKQGHDLARRLAFGKLILRYDVLRCVPIFCLPVRRCHGPLSGERPALNRWV